MHASPLFIISVTHATSGIARFDLGLLTVCLRTAEWWLVGYGKEQAGKRPAPQTGKLVCPDISLNKIPVHLTEPRTGR